MWVQFFIWTLHVHYGLSAFFNTPGNIHQPIYSDETHDDLLRQLAGKRSSVETGDDQFNIQNAVRSGISVAPFSNVEVEKDNSGNYILSSGTNKPPIQTLLDKMFFNYNLGEVTTLLDGSEIIFDNGMVSSDGLITLNGKIKAMSFNQELQLKNIVFKVSWQDQLDSRTNKIGGRPNMFTMKNLAIKMTSEHISSNKRTANTNTNVKGEEIEIDIVKQINEETKFTIKKYDTLDKTGSFNIFAFLGDFYSEITPDMVATDFDGIDADKISQINFDRKFTGFGHFSTDGGYQLVLQSDGSMGNVKAFDDAGPDMKMIINRIAGKGVNIALIGQFGSTDNVKDVVKAVTSNRDESFFDRMKNRDYCLTMSRDKFNIVVSDVVFDRYESSFKTCFPTEFQENTKDLPLKSGIAVRVQMSLKKAAHENGPSNDECLEKACDDECKKQYESTIMIGHLTSTGITWSYSKSNKIDMLVYLQCVGKDSSLFSDLPLTLINPDKEGKMAIYDFHQELGFLSVTMRATFPDRDMSIFETTKVKTIDLTYEFTDTEIKKDEDEDDENEDGGEDGGNEIGGGGFDPRLNEPNKEPKKEKPRFRHHAAITIDAVGQNDEQKNVMCEGDFPFKEFECVMYIASMTLAEGLAHIIDKDKISKITSDPSLTGSKILNTGLKNIELKYTSGNNKKFSFVSQISLGSYDGISIEILWYKTHGWGFGLSVSKLDVEYIIKLFLEWTGIKVSLPWLRNVEAYVIYSKINLDEVKAADEENNREPSRRNILQNFQEKAQLAESRSSINTRAEWLQSFVNRVKKRKSDKSENKLKKESKQKNKNQKVNMKKKSNDKKGIKKKDGKKQSAKSSKSIRKKLKGKALRSRKQKPSADNMEAADEPTANDDQQSGGSSNQEDDDEEDDEEEDDKYKFSLTSLKKQSIEEGFRFMFTWFAPNYEEECYGDSICKFIVKNAAGAQLSIGGGYCERNSSFYFSAKLSVTIPLNEDETLTFEEAELQIGISKEVKKTYIMMSATLQYLTDEMNLKFTGLIKASLSGKLELQFTMKGFVYEPLKINYFAVGDLYLGATISIENGKFSITIELGATIGIGKVIREEGRKPRFDGNQLIMTGFFGLNPINIGDSWVYAHMTKLTFGMIADAFGQTEKFPESFREDGYHNGLLFSYSNDDREIEALSKTISKGIHLAGGCKFAFLESTADFNINYLEGEFEILMDFKPINLLGGLITFTDNEDSEKGPHFYLKAVISDPAKLEINIRARLRIFGYGLGTTIIINNQQLIIEVNMGLVLFEVGVRLELVLGSTVPSGATICLFLQKTDFAQKLKDWLKNSIKAIRGDAEKVQERKNNVEQNANNEKEDADKKKDAWGKKINAWETKIKDKKEELEEKAKQSAREYQRCKDSCNRLENQICIPFLDWDSKCWKVWGLWIGCPKWNKCFTKIPDPFCLLGCEAEHLKNSFLEFVQGAINKIEKAISVVAGGLNKLVNAFKGAIQLLQNAVTELVNFVRELVSKVLEFALDIFLNMINLQVNKLELKATFGLGFRKCFSYEYDIEAFGCPLGSPPHEETEICLDEILITVAKWIFGIAPKLKEHDEYYKKKDKAEGFVESVEEAEGEIRKTDTKTTEEVDIETAKEVVEGIEKRNELPTHHNFFKHVDKIKNKYYHQYSDEDLQVLNTPHHMKPYEKPSHLMKFMKEKAPWKIAQQTIDNPPSHLPQLVSNVTVVKRSLILGDPKLSPCDRVKRSLHDYSTLTNGLMQSIMHMENGKVSMNVQRRSDVNKLSEFYAKTHKLGTEYTNYTPRQKRDIYYWYEQLKDGYQEHFRLTKRSFVEHQRDTLPKVKESLDDILGKHVGSSFESYTDELHRHAIDGFKRSNIPRPNDGETLLHGIRRNLTLIVTNEEFPLTHMKRHLNNVNQAIRAVNKQVMQC